MKEHIWFEEYTELTPELWAKILERAKKYRLEIVPLVLHPRDYKEYMKELWEIWEKHETS